MSRTRPRDGDGDGLVYDGTPRQRPWNPLTDLPYPDGKVPEAVRRRQQKARSVEPPGPRRPVERRPNKGWHDLQWPPPSEPPVTREGIEAAFTYDDGDYYVKATVEPYDGYLDAAPTSSLAVKVSGSIMRRGAAGDFPIGEFTRKIDPAQGAGHFAVAEFSELLINDDWQGKGIGSRLFAAQVDGLREAGVDRIVVEAVSDPEEGLNGAYTWARAGYDWKPGTRSHASVARAILWDADPDNRAKLLLDELDPEVAAAARDLAARLEAVRQLPDDPAKYPEDFPTLNDVAMLGWTPGAETWFGKEVLSGNDLTWFGALDLHPERGQLGVDDIGELPNPFAERLPGGESGSAPEAPAVESPVKLTTKVNTIAPDFTPEQAEQFARFLTRETGMSQYAGDKYLAMNVRSFVQGYSTREWLDPLFTTDTPDPDAVALVQAWRRNLLDHVAEKGGDGVTLHRGIVDKDTDPFVPMRTDHWSNAYNDVRPQRSDAAIAGITSWTSVKTEAKQFGGHNVTRDIPLDQLIGRFGSIKGEVLVADDPLVTRALDAWPNDVDGVPAAPFGTFPERYREARGADAPEAPTEVTFYEVGGAVRDDLMDIFSDDVDFAVTAPSYEAMKAHLEAEGFRIFQEREEFATIKAKVPDGHPLQARTHVADFVLARRDGPSSDGRRPDYTEPGTLEEDLARRDFTVNAIARDVDGNLIDPFGGQADIESRTLRFVGDPMQRVREDGLRVLRGFRFMVTKQLTPEPETWAALTSDEAAEMLLSVSKERVSNELQKMLDYDTLGAVQLLGQLPTPVLDAIFRDGVRLAPNLGKVKGQVRDPDLPRAELNLSTLNPFTVDAGDGNVIELGSGPAGWERKPGPDRAIRRADLPRRYVNDWSLPAKAELARAFLKDLPNGYQVRAEAFDGGVVAAKVYSPDGDEVGFANWKIRDDSPTAYLSLMQIVSAEQGKGIGSQMFAAAVDSLRDLGVDTIELLAISSDNTNGGYTWARAGFDWEPGGWELPDLAVRLATFARDGRGHLAVGAGPDGSMGVVPGKGSPYSTEDQQEAFRIAGLLTTLGDDLPYDPAEYPEDLPTPNDVAMIGWTPGATSWLGKDFLSGPDPITSDVAAGRKTVQDMLDEAERDGFLADFVGYWRSGWKEGDEYPPIIERMRTNQPWQLNRRQVLLAPDDPDRWEESDSPEEDRLDVYKVFAAHREHRTGRLDPLFFGTDAVALANMDPAEVAIVETEPVPGGMGVQMSALGEWRTPTGDAVVITDIVAPAAVTAAVARRVARKLLRAPDMGGGGGGAYLRSKGLWNDPGSGKFAPIGWSTKKAKDLKDRQLLADIIEDAVRSHPDGVMVQVGRDLLRAKGIDLGEGDWHRARLTEQGIEVDLPTGSRPPFVSYIVDVDDLRDVHVQMPEDSRPPLPDGPSFTIDPLAVARGAEELGIEDVKVWVQGDALGPDGETPDWLKDILGGEPARVDWEWDARAKVWRERRLFSVEGAYRGYRVSVEATAEDVTGADGRERRAMRYTMRYIDERNLSQGFTDTAYDIDADVTDELLAAVQGVKARVDRDAGPPPPAEGVLVAEDPIGYNDFLQALDAGPGWDERTLTPADREAVARFRARVTLYGESVRSGTPPSEALDDVRGAEVNTSLWLTEQWRGIIEGRGYLSANIRALRGEEGFGEPDPDAIRFLQLLREDFLAKVPGSAQPAIRLYRATDDPDPWGGNPPDRFGTDAWRKPASGVTSWAFLSAADAKSRLSGYGQYLHGEDVPLDRVLGRFGAVTGELLVADAAIVEAIESFDFGPPRERAIKMLADLPDDPFAKPVLSLPASERGFMAIDLDNLVDGIDTLAPSIKRRFPELTDDDARKLALLGGVPEGATTPWKVTPEWVSEVPWERLRDFAVDTIYRQRGQRLEVVDDDERIQLGARALAMLRADVSTLHPSGDRTQADELPLLPAGPLWLRPTQSVLGRVSQTVSVPSERQANTDLLDSDREALDAITAAGRVLLSDLRSEVRAVTGADPEQQVAYDAAAHEALALRRDLAASRHEDNAVEARNFIEANGVAWVEGLGVDHSDWPVGPFAWEPVESFLDVKAPKFVDAEGRRYRMAPYYGPGGNVSGWRIEKYDNDYASYPVVPGDDGRLVAATLPAPMAASIDAALEAIGVAQDAWWEARNLDEEYRDLELLRDSQQVQALGYSLRDIRNERQYQLRTNLWTFFTGLANGDRDATTRPLFFNYDVAALQGKWSSGEPDQIKVLADDAVDKVVDALGTQKVRIGSPRLQRADGAGDTVLIPLDEPDLRKMGWGRGELIVQPRQGRDEVEVTLQLWRMDAAPNDPPAILSAWTDRAMPNLGRHAEVLGAEQRQLNRLTARQGEVRERTVRRWAASTLNATTEPLIADGSDPAKAERMARAATPFVPDSLKLSVEPVLVRDVEADSLYRNRSYYRPGNQPTMFMAERAGDDTYLHEYGHHIERIGPIGRAVWAFYQHRTNGEDPIRLSELVPGSSYDEHEVARPDEFFHPYAGKDYGSVTKRSNAGRSELLTLGLEGVFYDEKGVDGQAIDDEYAAFILGLLLHAGHRAERYYPDLTEGGEAGDVPASIKDLDDLLQERAERSPRRRRSRSHFGRIVSEGRTVFGGDADNPFIVEDELRDRDNPIGSPAPTVTPDPVAVAAASQLTRRSVERAARGDAEPSQALREVIQRSQQALREQGIETVTLYRGAREGEDPFRPSSSGLIRARRPGSITSWTSNPERASSFADTPGLTVHRAEVPVSQIVSYDLVGQHSATQGWRAGGDLTGGEVLVAADPSVVEALLDGRVTPDATMEGDGAAVPAPA